MHGRTIEPQDLGELGEALERRITWSVRAFRAGVAQGFSAPRTFVVYDALGRRYSKTVSGTVNLLDRDGEIAEMDGSDNVLRRFVTASAVDDRIADIEGSSATPAGANHTYFHVNHQGSAVAMTDAVVNATGCANGSLSQRLSYDEYGNLSSAATTTGQPFRYTGRRYDSETGLTTTLHDTTHLSSGVSVEAHEAGHLANRARDTIETALTG